MCLKILISCFTGLIWCQQISVLTNVDWANAIQTMWECYKADSLWFYWHVNLPQHKKNRTPINTDDGNIWRIIDFLSTIFMAVNKTSETEVIATSDTFNAAIKIHFRPFIDFWGKFWLWILRLIQSIFIVNCSLRACEKTIHSIALFTLRMLLDFLWG